MSSACENYEIWCGLIHVYISLFVCMYVYTHISMYTYTYILRRLFNPSKRIGDYNIKELLWQQLYFN